MGGALQPDGDAEDQENQGEVRAGYLEEGPGGVDVSVDRQLGAVGEDHSPEHDGCEGVEDADGGEKSSQNAPKVGNWVVKSFISPKVLYY